LCCCKKFIFCSESFYCYRLGVNFLIISVGKLALIF
jgi:hypothetical protein